MHSTKNIKFTQLGVNTFVGVTSYLSGNRGFTV